MKLTYFVNAMFMLEGKETRVLCDPWITFGAQSASGLYNFPETSLSRDDVRALAPNFIYISHTHADHFDAPTLALFSKKTPILVATYADNFTERNARKLGFEDVRVVDPRHGVPLNGDDHCWIETSAVYPEVDSIGTFSIDGMRVINANDVPFSLEQCTSLRERFSPIDLAMVPFSFQGPYPAFYENLTDEEREAEAHKKRARSYDQLSSYASTLDPRFVFPFAAGALYGGAKALRSKYYGVGSVREALNILRMRSTATPILLSESVAYDFELGERIGTYVEKNYETESEYLQRISEKASSFDQGGLFFIDPSLRIDLTRLLGRARERQMKWQQASGVKSLAVFFLDVNVEHLYRLSLADTTVTKVREADIEDEKFEIFRLPYSLLIGLLTGHYNWSNVKTQHMWFYRKPNVFDPELHILMSYLQA